MSDYVIWQYQDVENGCCLFELNGYDQVYKLYDGDAVTEEFPIDVSYDMDPEFPEDHKIPDNVMNNLDLVIISDRIKTFIADCTVQHIELLPINLINHHHRKVSRPHFILHTVQPLDCLDIEASGGQWDVIDDQSIETVDNIVFKSDADFEDRVLFRAKYFSDALFVRRDFAEKLGKQAFSGLKFIEFEQYICE